MSLKSSMCFLNLCSRLSNDQGLSKKNVSSRFSLGNSSRWTFRFVQIFGTSLSENKFRISISDEWSNRCEKFFDLERKKNGFSLKFFRKLFLEAFASNVKRKLKESYDLFRIVHIHIPEIIPPILTMHQGFLKVRRKPEEDREIDGESMMNRIPIPNYERSEFAFLSMF